MFANQPSIMSVDGVISWVLLLIVVGGIAYCIEKAKNAEIRWRERRKKEKAKDREGRNGNDA